MKQIYKYSADRIRLIIPPKFKEFIKNKLSYNRIFIFLYKQYLKKIIGIKENPKEIPRRITIEATNHCNANCIMCPRESSRRKRGFIDIQLYKKIIKDCVKNDVKEIRLHNFGEPLLHPKIIDLIKIAKGQGIRVSFFTNGSLLTEEISKKIIKSKLDEIWISVDSHKREGYNRIRRGLDFDRLDNNLNNLIRLRKIMKSKKPHIIISHTLINPKDKYIFIKKWKKKVDNILLSFYHDWSGNINLKKEEKPIKRWPCPLLWTRIFILWDGRVTFCCRDYDGHVILGDVNKQSLKDIYFSKSYAGLRRLHLEGKENLIPLCKECNSQFFY